MFEKDSPIWPIISRMVIYITLGILTVWGLSTGYKEGWVARSDVPVFLKIVGGMATLDVGKTVVTKAMEKINDK